MSEPNQVFPLLSDYAMGSPISEHHGVRSYPAMQKDSDNKYIVKIISIPASARNLDALLLAGAFPSAEAAGEYFQELSEGVIKEAQILQQLSKLEGFLAHKDWQVIPLEKGTGFEICLIGDYRYSLERYFRREAMTHLGAVNLGLDLCAALAVCRRCGYLYINLKPSNVFVCDDREYRIGDIGFVALDTLQYASLPDRYRSAYTAPEIADAYCTLNTTLDIYAVGLILYQAYNNGVLPFDDVAPAEPLSAPMYADYEMAEIILKACHPDPQQRWQDPLEMGKALVSYMQRNNINDVPITPPAAPEEPVVTDEEVLDEELAEDIPEETEDGQTVIEQWLSEESEVLPEIPEEVSAEEDVPPAEENTDPAPADEQQLSLADLEEASDDETLPSDESVLGLEDAPLTEDADDILSLADELIAHELPEPVAVPETVDISQPENPEEAPAEEPATEGDAEEAKESEAEETEEAESADQAEEEAPVPAPAKKPRSFKGLIIFLLVVAIGLSLFTGGYAFYKFYYLQTIDNISLVNRDEQLTVVLDTDVDDALLTVVCKDTYGNTLRQGVTNGKAVFDTLNPGTSYKIYVEISGLHTLKGKTETSFTTAEQTSLLNLSVVAGAEEGTAILSFTVQGPDSSWQVVCSADGKEIVVPCTDHTATIQGLTPGVTYTIRLVPAASLYVVGEDTITYTAIKMVYAEDLTVQSFVDNKLTVTWKAPEDANVKNWTVRCYNNNGTDKTVTVQDMTAVFEGLDPAASYNIEVTAEGMTQGVTTYVSENAVSVSDLAVSPSGANLLKVTWLYSGNAPKDGWRVLYYIDGSREPMVVNTENTEAELPLVPGSHYEISVMQADGSTVFGGSATYDTDEAASFSGYWLTAESLDFKTCLPTELQVVNADLVTYATTFAPGAKASILMHTFQKYQNSYDEIVNLYVIRDSNGAVVSATNPVRLWADMLEGGFGLINLPAVPNVAGEYTVDIFFNSMFVATVPFAVG